jgi:DNA-binding transcriptional MerR regulator
VVNVTENGKQEETLKSYWAKDIAELLDISTSNLRRWSIDLENEGYSFYRDEHHRRAYLERDIMPLKKLKEFLANNMSKNDAVKAVVSMFPTDDNGVITIPVIKDEVRLSRLELQEIVQEAVREAVEEEREEMFKAFDHKINDTLEKRDRLLTQHLQATLEERRLEIAAAQEKKKWWEFWK